MSETVADPEKGTDRAEPVLRRELLSMIPAFPCGQVACKCCGGKATPWGVADFNRSANGAGCAGVPWQQWDLSGIPVHYHRCHACGAIFTTAFDGFSRTDFSQYIYNEGYARVDPDYQQARPQANAQFISNLLGANRDIPLLDYGGGNGYLARCLRQAGFTDAHTYDPFVPEYASKPSRRFQCLFAFEVVEHSNHPWETFEEMASLLDEEGLIVFSTVLQPPDIDQQRMNWWYIAPRNGHVTLYTGAALHTIAQRLGFSCCSRDGMIHAMFRERVPAFAQHSIRL